MFITPRVVTDWVTTCTGDAIPTSIGPTVLRNLMSQKQEAIIIATSSPERKTMDDKQKLYNLLKEALQLAEKIKADESEEE